MWFRCHKCGHRQWSSPNNKTLHNKVGGCRACLDQVVNNFDQRNSFGKVYPELVQFWDYERNTDTPYDITRGIGSKRWFKCRTCGRSHLIQVYLFPRLDGCSECVRQIHTSFGEYAVAYYLRKCGLDVIHRDRTVLDGLELDVYVSSMKLAVEYDGRFYHSQPDAVRKQKLKYQKCRELGITLLRICECQSEVESASVDVSDVCDWFTAFRSTPNRKNHASAIKMMLEHLGLTCDVNLDRDGDEIDCPRRTGRVENSVARNDKLSKMWISEKNDVNPDSVSANASAMKYWFRCPRCGREWFTDPYTANRGGGCRMCHPQSKHKKVVEKTEDGTRVIRIWASAYEAEKSLNLPIGGIRRAIRGERKRSANPHILNGSLWEYL